RGFASISGLFVCNCSTARSILFSRSDSEALCVVSGWIVASMLASRAILLVEEYFVTNMTLSCFTARLADDCWFRSLGILKSDCVPRLFVCCEATPVFPGTPTQAESIGGETAERLCRADTCEA